MKLSVKTCGELFHMHVRVCFNPWGHKTILLKISNFNYQKMNFIILSEKPWGPAKTKIKCFIFSWCGIGFTFWLHSKKPTETFDKLFLVLHVVLLQVYMIAVPDRFEFKISLKTVIVSDLSTIFGTRYGSFDISLLEILSIWFLPKQNMFNLNCSL